MHTHSDRLDRWLGAQTVDHLSACMRDFYYPVAVHGVPGAVYAMPGGDFTGEIQAGQECSALDRARAVEVRLRNELRAKLAQQAIWQSDSLRRRVDRNYYAFASLSALLEAARGGKRADYFFQKSGITCATNSSVDLWTRGTFPAAGSAAGAAPGGTVLTSASTGAIPFKNAVANANTTHFAGGYAQATFGPDTLLLYDRLFAVAKTMASTATEAVTGVPSRYTSQIQADADYVGGNFCFPSNSTNLANTQHNWTVCQYTNQGGATGQSFPSATGQGNLAAPTIDLGTTSNNGNSQWFLPLAAGDVGVKELTQMQCSASVTGTLDFVIGHPIAWFPCPVANMICPVDGLMTAFNLASIFDDACLAFLAVNRVTTSANYSGQITVVSE